MSLVTTEDALAHVREDEGANIDVYLAAAEQAALDFLDRAVYATPEELAQQQAGQPASIAAAAAARDAAIAAASALTGDAQAMAIRAAGSAYAASLALAQRVYDGMVLNDAVRSAILLTFGHLYRNREDVITGASAAAVQLPFGARALLWPHRKGLGI